MNQNTLEALLLGISQPAIFFLPRKLFEKAIGKDLSELDNIKFTNHLIVRNKKNEYKVYSNIYDALPITDKKVILNSNFFEILKMREQYNDDTFKFFIDQYFAELDTWLTVAELTKKMTDDIKIILAEYRLALKKNNKYKLDRDI